MTPGIMTSLITTCITIASCAMSGGRRGGKTKGIGIGEMVMVMV